MKMIALRGVELDGNALLGQMRRVADYIYFDGPLLTHFRGAHGSSYLRYWCDTDGRRNRWMLFQVPEADRVAYVEHQKSLHDLVKNKCNLFVYFIETNTTGETVETMLVPMDNIPPNYVPAIESFYQSKPSNISDEGEHSYTVLIDESWSLADLGEFRRLYGRAYSFIFALQEMFPEGTRIGSLRHTFSKLPWKGGFSAMHFFNDIVSVVPREESPQVLSMQFASPGWIELKVSTPVALRVRQIAHNVGEMRNSIEGEINAIRDALRDRGLLGGKGKAVQDELSEEDSVAIKRLYLDYCKTITFPLTKELLAATPNPLAALKILMSFTRRLWELNDFGSGNKVRL